MLVSLEVSVSVISTRSGCSILNFPGGGKDVGGVQTALPSRGVTC